MFRKQVQEILYDIKYSIRIGKPYQNNEYDIAQIVLTIVGSIYQTVLITQEVYITSFGRQSSSLSPDDSSSLSPDDSSPYMLKVVVVLSFGIGIDNSLYLGEVSSNE